MHKLEILFTKKQEKQIDKFKNNRICKQHSLSYKIESKSSIGLEIYIYCPNCKYEEDITDIDLW